jgi:hypothetical protein
VSNLSSIFEFKTVVESFVEIEINTMIMMSLFVDYPQLLFTLNQPPTDSDGRPRLVRGVVMLDKYLCVVYNEYNKVQVFSCEDGLPKIKEIQVIGMNSPYGMVGCSVTSQLFVCASGNIFRVNVNTEVSDVFIKLGYKFATLSLVENRLLVTSRYSLLMYDIHSGQRMKKIPYTEDMKKYGVKHAIESNRDSFFVCHKQSYGGPRTVSEINSKGRVIRVFNNKEQLDCGHLTLDSVGRLLVVDWGNYSVVLLDEHLQFTTILLDKERLDDVRPVTLKYNKNNNRLAVGLNNGHVKTLTCSCFSDKSVVSSESTHTSMLPVAPRVTG